MCICKSCVLIKMYGCGIYWNIFSLQHGVTLKIYPGSVILSVVRLAVANIRQCSDSSASLLPTKFGCFRREASSKRRRNRKGTGESSRTGR